MAATLMTWSGDTCNDDGVDTLTSCETTTTFSRPSGAGGCPAE